MGEEKKKPKRPHGEGGIRWDERRKRFIAEKTVGYTPAGKRIVRTGSGRIEREAWANLRERVKEYEAGLAPGAQHYTVRHAVEDWLAYGLAGRDPDTVAKCESLCRTHITPKLGARKLRDLKAADIDRWLADRAKVLASRSLGEVVQCLNRAVRRAMARDYVGRNVVELCEIPQGREGRRSKSLTLDQAVAVLRVSDEIGGTIDAYINLSILVGARTEELRALRWDHVDLIGKADAKLTRPASIQVWRSVRAHGDTKTRKSRRTLALPKRCVAKLRVHKQWQAMAKERAGTSWKDNGLVFATFRGTAMDAGNVRRQFRRVVAAAGLNGADWTPRELRHSFVSLLSEHGLSVEQIADLAGHAGTSVTEKVYRHELRPVLLDGAMAMDEIFPDESPADEEQGDDGAEPD